jgi:hypothetical protein
LLADGWWCGCIGVVYCGSGVLVEAWEIYPFSRTFSRFAAFSLSFYVEAQLELGNCNGREGRRDDLGVESVGGPRHVRKRYLHTELHFIPSRQASWISESAVLAIPQPEKRDYIGHYSSTCVEEQVLSSGVLLPRRETLLVKS